jgi:hypothetical protein
MGEAITVVVALAAFLGIYALLRRRAGSPPVRWGWIAAIVGCAAIVVVVGLITR